MGKRGIIIAGVIVTGIFVFFMLISLILSLGVQSAGQGMYAVSGKGNMGLIEIHGIILNPKPYLDQLAQFEDNDKIKGILVRIDSPGGTAAASQEVYDEILKLRSKNNKKFVVSMGNAATSGALYIACAADTIVANLGTITGSIGVKAEFINLQTLLSKLGVKQTVVKSGKYKDVGNYSRPVTQEEKRLMQSIIDDIYDQFVTAVSESRHISKEDVRKIADGRIFTGRQGKEYGLVDVIGNYNDAARLLANMTGVEGKPKFVKKKTRPRLFDLLYDNIQESIQKALFTMLYDTRYILLR